MLGAIAMILVMNALLNLLTRTLINPDMTNYPASVPVSVDDYPAASSPMPQIYLAAAPKLSSKTVAAELRSRSKSVLYQFAKVPITARLIKNEIRSDIPVSILK